MLLLLLLILSLLLLLLLLFRYKKAISCHFILFQTATHEILVTVI